MLQSVCKVWILWIVPLLIQIISTTRQTGYFWEEGKGDDKKEEDKNMTSSTKRIHQHTFQEENYQ